MSNESTIIKTIVIGIVMFILTSAMGAVSAGFFKVREDVQQMKIDYAEQQTAVTKDIEYIKIAIDKIARNLS